MIKLGRPRFAKKGFLDWAYLCRKYPFYQQEIYRFRKDQEKLKQIKEKADMRMGIAIEANIEPEITTEVIEAGKND